MLISVPISTNLKQRYSVAFKQCCDIDMLIFILQVLYSVAFKQCCDIDMLIFILQVSYSVAFKQCCDIDMQLLSIENVAESECLVTLNDSK
jgi:hypothetical protein